MRLIFIDAAVALLSAFIFGIGAAIFWFIDFACGIEQTDDCTSSSHITSLWFWRAVIAIATFSAIFLIYKSGEKFKQSIKKQNEKRTSR